MFARIQKKMVNNGQAIPTFPFKLVAISPGLTKLMLRQTLSQHSLLSFNIFVTK